MTNDSVTTHPVTPRLLFRTFAFAEVATWAGLITGLIIRQNGGDPLWVSVTGGIHGFVFLCYAVITVFVWVNQRWKFGVGALGLLAAIIPFATLPFELITDKKGMLNGFWRLRPGGDAPRGFIEHVQAWVLRHPYLSIALGIAGVVTAYIVLLILGPPVPRD